MGVSMSEDGVVVISCCEGGRDDGGDGKKRGQKKNRDNEGRGNRGRVKIGGGRVRKNSFRAILGVLFNPVSGLSLENGMVKQKR